MRPRRRGAHLDTITPAYYGCTPAYYGFAGILLPYMRPLPLLYMCPHTTTLLHVCSHTTKHVSSYYDYMRAHIEAGPDSVLILQLYARLPV